MRRARRNRLLGAAGLLVVLLVGAVVVGLSGLVPIKASSGHWRITEWMLQLGKRRSVATHSMGIAPLQLDAPWLVLKGAGHYESGCRPCHGSPELPHPRIAELMTPLPPYLPPRATLWEPEELFYIVKHGIKFTGMPAWRAQTRDDEVVAMVAFLLAMPGLDAAAYERLVYGATRQRAAAVPLQNLAELEPPPPPVTTACARCHGTDGLGRGTAAFPKLAGQRSTYMRAALDAYANGERYSGIMEPVAAGLSEEERQEVSDFYAALPAGASTTPLDSVSNLPQVILEGAGEGGAPLRGDSERGRRIASRGVPELGVPSCMDCHGPGDGPRNPSYPLLASQYGDYLVLQLRLFQERRRGGSPFAEIMHHVVDGLDEQQIVDVALFYATLPAAVSAEP